MVFKYDQDADVLSIEVSKEPIDYAEEMGDFVVHFTQKNKPVLLEILNARQFVQKSFRRFSPQTKKAIFKTA